MDHASSMWLKNGIGVCTFEAPVPSRLSWSAISVSFVLRSTRACRSCRRSSLSPPRCPVAARPPAVAGRAPRPAPAPPGAAAPPQPGRRVLDHARALHEVLRPERRREPRGAGRGQHVVGSGHVVADHLRRVRRPGRSRRRAARAAAARPGTATISSRCSGARRLASVDRVVEVGHQDERAVGRQRLGGDRPARQRARAGRLERRLPRAGTARRASVISSARAIGSCSAWASRSAAIQRGIGVRDRRRRRPRSARPPCRCRRRRRRAALASAT